MVYPPECDPEPEAEDEPEPKPEVTEWRRPSYDVAEPVKNPSNYQYGPDTYLLSVADADFPARLREYLSVAKQHSADFQDVKVGPKIFFNQIYCILLIGNYVLSLIRKKTILHLQDLLGYSYRSTAENAKRSYTIVDNKIIAAYNDESNSIIISDQILIRFLNSKVLHNL